MCKRNNKELTPEHIKICESFKDEGNLDELIRTLKTTNIREWQRPEIIKGITDAIRMTCKIHSLKQSGEIMLV